MTKSRPPRRKRARRKRPVPKRKRSPSRTSASRGTFWKLGAALSLLVLISFAAVSVHYYALFNRLVDTRLVRATAGAPEIYARPIRLEVGQSARAAAWKWRLEAAGYETQTAETENGTELRVSPLGESPALRLLFHSGVLALIVRGNSQARTVQLGPQFLSSVAGSRLEKTRHLSLAQLPQQLIHAVLAAEDQRFYKHPGVDVLTLIRAVARNLWRWDWGHGGSTITQQLAKNFFLSPEKQVRRKLEEMYFALLLERRFSKDQILEFYLNNTYLGQIGGFAIHGFGQASLSYFGRELEALDLSETAALVGMIPAPNRYSPYRNPEAVLTRRAYVLDRMEAEGFITPRQKADAGARDLHFRPASFQESSQAPYFVDLVSDLLQRDYGLQPSSQQEIEVYSTLDPGLQHLAFQAVGEGLRDIEALLQRRRSPPLPQAAMVVLDPATGELLALIGGHDYAASPFNRAVYAFRPPGSTMKPFVLAAALEGGAQRPALNLSSRILDEPYTFQYEGRRYSPGNYGQRYHGMVSLRQALALSLNVPTVKLAEAVGFDELLDRYHKLDLGENWKPYPSLALGTFEISLLQLAQAYQVLANEGRLVPLRASRKVVAQGAALAEPQRLTRQVISREVAFLVVSALQSVLDEGTAKAVRQRGFSVPAAGKTGTTDDSWFVGFTPELLCAVWVGSDGSPALDLSGSKAALPIWLRFMKSARDAGYLSGRAFPIPPGVEKVVIDEETGLRATPQCTNVREEFFLEGTAPALYCEGKPNQAELRPPERRKKKGFLGWLGRVFGRREP